MQSRTMLNGNGRPQMHEIRIEAHGTGGELGLKNIQILTGMIEDLKAQKTPEEVDSHFMMICGYTACCVNSGFLDEKSGNELMQLTAMLAENEEKRAEHESKGAKA